jgi:hypothetical protein
MQLINLTPHALTIEALDGSTLTLPPSGTVARLRVDRQTRTPLEVDGRSVGLSCPTLRGPVNLPDPEQAPGTIYVVSTLVADAVKRPDVMSPGELLRDDEGRPLRCRGLNCFA